MIKLRLKRQKEIEKKFQHITGIGYDGRSDETFYNCRVNEKHRTSSKHKKFYVHIVESVN